MSLKCFIIRKQMPQNIHILLTYLLQSGDVCSTLKEMDFFGALTFLIDSAIEQITFKESKDSSRRSCRVHDLQYLPHP